MRDIRRKTKGQPDLEAAFAHALMLAERVHMQNKTLRPVRGQPADPDLRVFSLPAPEVACIGKGKPHKPYEFGVKVSVATTLITKGRPVRPHRRPPHPLRGRGPLAGSAHVQALPLLATPACFAGRSLWLPPPGKPYDAHTLAIVIPAIEAQVGATLPRIIADASGDAVNVVLAVVGYNFRNLLAWLRLLLAAFWLALADAGQPIQPCKAA